MTNRVLVVGDVMLDLYTEGASTRISPEAPVPVILNTKTNSFLGGAANVAANLSAMGLSVDLLGLIGNDQNGIHFEQLLKKERINWCGHISRYATTTVKQRIVSNGFQITRLDTELNPITSDIDKCFELFKNIFSSYDVIVFSDYNKGVLKEIEAFVSLISNTKIISIADPKVSDLTRYNGVTYLKPNKIELLKFTALIGCDEEAIEDLITKAYQALDVSNLIVTLGHEGCAMKAKNQYYFLPAETSEVFDVTGAGDSFLAGFVENLITYPDATIPFILSRANRCASVAVKFAGTKVVGKKDLPNSGLVFTNGCFDIIHLGHISLLKRAKSLGDKLIIGLNSDASAKQLKGQQRPINNQNDRRSLLLDLDLADEVIIFDAPTPIDLIKEIKPDILVKGGDYELDAIVGADFVRKAGGKVLTLPYLTGFSTSSIIERANQ